MLSKTRGEESSIKTVTLARGTFSGLSPPGMSSVRSSDRSSLPHTASPEGRDRNDPLRLLGSVGVLELLEQDTRPTFVVDISDASNYVPASTGIQIVFANSALRASPSVWELVTRKVPVAKVDEVEAHASHQFKGWLLSTVVQGESLNVNPSPVEHGGIVWSCYTLRKRLRVVSGTTTSPVAASIPSMSASTEFAIPSSSSATFARSGLGRSSSPLVQSDPTDYFGASVSAGIEETLSEESIPATATSGSMASAMEITSTPAERPSSKPDKLELRPIEDPSFANECVLRAQSAGDVDAFYRNPSPSPDHDVGFFDWTRLAISPTLPRHIQFARSIDWASTPLGPIELWSNDLRAMCNLIMYVR
jgi:hypothetical protein